MVVRGALTLVSASAKRLACILVAGIRSAERRRAVECRNVDACAIRSLIRNALRVQAAAERAAVAVFRAARAAGLGSGVARVRPARNVLRHALARSDADRRSGDGRMRPPVVTDDPRSGNAGAGARLMKRRILDLEPLRRRPPAGVRRSARCGAHERDAGDDGGARENELLHARTVASRSGARKTRGSSRGWRSTATAA